MPPRRDVLALAMIAVLGSALGACTAPRERARMTAATVARKVDAPAQVPRWAQKKGRLASISGVSTQEPLPTLDPPWVSTTGSVARPTEFAPRPVLGRARKRVTATLITASMPVDAVTAAERPDCLVATVRSSGNELTVEIEGEGLYVVQRERGQLPGLPRALRGVCAVRIGAGGMAYTELIGLMDAVYRTGVADIAVAAGDHIEELSLPGIFGSRYTKARPRDHLRDAPIVIIGRRHLALRTRAPAPGEVRVMAPRAALDDLAPYQELHERLVAAREALPPGSTTVVLEASRTTPGVAIARIVSAAGAAGFVDVLFTARD